MRMKLTQSLAILGSLVIASLLFAHNNIYAYTFGMLSHDDTVESIQEMEARYDLMLPMVSFIWDDYDKLAQSVVNQLPRTLGTGRVYHITLSPRHYTAEQVYGGYFDREYTLLFKHIKNTGIKVVFRTMHEMNG